MASDSVPHPFDVTTVEHLIALMASHDLAEIVLREGNQMIRLRRGGTPNVVAALPPVPSSAGASGAAPPVAPPAPAAKKLLDITSEMVGTVYLKPKPDKDDYIRVGQTIKPDMTVCTIEAMKIFNEIKANVAGTVAEVCVANGDGVHYGTVLFRIDPGL